MRQIVFAFFLGLLSLTGCGQDDDPTQDVRQDLEQDRIAEDAELQRQSQIEAQEEKMAELEADHLEPEDGTEP